MRVKIPIKLVELETENYHIIVESEFKNGIFGNWVIDTGASKTVFDKNLEKYYSDLMDESEEIHSAGINEEPLETSLAILNPFSFEKFEVESFIVALLDLSHINKLYSKSANIEICGLLGGDFLMKYKTIINYRKKWLMLQV